ncbi:MAG: helix-turn-helix transcriptional regulator [Phycisphaerae bacterium]
MARGDNLFRQWELIRVLQNNRFGVSTDELAQRLECNKRTVQRDLSVLQDIFPIDYEERDRGKRFWTLRGNTVESRQLQLTMTEMLSLYLSQQLLLPLSGTQFGDGLQTAIQKIRTLLPAKALSYFEGLDEAFLIKNLACHDYSGQDREIRRLNEAILNEKAVRVVYHSASRDRRVTSELHPYGMVLLQASLYCIGRLCCYGEVRTLKVTRIESVTPLEKSFEKPEGFSLAGHVRGAFGVFRTDTPRRIRAEFREWAATNVREMQWHPSQRIVSDDGETVIATFDLGSTVEFKRWMLGFGRHARVTSPPDLAEDIRQEHLAAAEQG